jgi:hypothetical protein
MRYFFRMRLIFALLACAEKPNDYAVQHDVGRLCAAWARCDAPDCSAFAKEEGRMMSKWGRQVQKELAADADAALPVVADMASRSGADTMSPTCRRLVVSKP